MGPLDRFDRKILELLSVDARLSMAELARRVHLSRTAVLARVKRLESDGVICGYRADVRWPGSETAVSALLLLQFTTRPCAPVLAYLSGQPEVRSVWSLSGFHDAMALVSVPDAPALSALADRLAASPYAMRVETRTILS